MTDKYDRYRMWGCSGLVKEVEQLQANNKTARLHGELRAYKIVKAMQIPDWLSIKLTKEIKRTEELIKQSENRHE